MKKFVVAFKTLLISLGFMLTATQSVLADAVWHCSRSDMQIANASDDFTLAALNLDREVIRISLRDLHGVYQGEHVKMNGGLTLSACVIGNASKLTTLALKSIGAQNSTFKTLSTASSLAKNNIHVVPNEDAMLSCISKNHPAIGYLAKAINTEVAGPCF